MIYAMVYAGRWYDVWYDMIDMMHDMPCGTIYIMVWYTVYDMVCNVLYVESLLKSLSTIW